MKISVLGNIIETKYIYKITPVNIFNENCGGFVIKFLNKKDFLIKNYYGGGRIRSTQEDGFSIDKLEKLRQEVINYWNEDKSDIPQIEFEK